MNTLNFARVLGIAVLLAVNFSAGAVEAVASPSLSILKSVPLAELPGKAAALVAEAEAKTQTQTTVDVVRSAVGLNPAAAAAIVGSIAAGTPEMAAAAAATAASLLPKQAAALAQAAAAAAPQQAGKIVEAVCLVARDTYRDIALAVAEIVPNEARAILAGVAVALPDLNNSITNALAAYPGANPSVKLILSQIDKSGIALLAAGTPASISPNVHPVPGPGFVPPPPVPVILDPGQNGQVPTSGRNYANPVPVGGDYSP